MKLKMLEFKILIEQVESSKEEKGIIIPDTAKTKQLLFTVVQLGEYACDGEIEEGDIVLVDRYAGTEVMIDRHIYRIVDESDILVKIEK